MDIKTVMTEYGLSPLPDDTAEAMAYVPFQPYSPEMCKTALGYENGTLFKSLVKPFTGYRNGGTDD